MNTRDLLELIGLGTEGLIATEDGKIDEHEAERLSDRAAPMIARLYKKEDLPIEKWGLVRVFVLTVQKVVKIINERNGEL